MCVPAKTDSSNPMSQPPTSGLTLSLFSLGLFPLSTVLSFRLHLSVLASSSSYYPPRRSSGGWRGAAPDPSPDTIMSSITQEHFWHIVVSSKLQSVCLCAQARCAIIKLAKSHLREPFSSQHAFPLAGYSFRRGSQYRKESGLIGMPPPTVPACVFFSAALLWAHGNVGSDTQLQQILTRGGPRKWDFFSLMCLTREPFGLTQFYKW